MSTSEVAAESTAVAAAEPAPSRPMESSPDPAAWPAGISALVDRSVRVGKPAEQLPEVLAPQVSSVCQALVALEGGHDSQAAELLQSIPRQSPVSDWRWFVRGLTAFYRQDAEATRANWTRLDAARLAHRIASPLLGTVGITPPRAEAQTWDAWGRLESALGGKGAIGLIRELSSFVEEERWSDAFGKTQRLQGALKGNDEARRRLTRVLYRRLIDGAEDLVAEGGRVKFIGKLTRQLEPLPLDPQWHRLWALAYERGGGSMYELANAWRGYIASLPQSPAIPPDLIPKARALVWNHLAADYIDFAESAREQPLPVWGSPQPVDIQGAVAAWRESLRLWPDHVPTYEARFAALMRLDLPEQAHEACVETLEHLPDHLPSLEFLAMRLAVSDRPAEALPYAQRGQQLKPLDGKWKDLHAAVHKGAARQFALEEKWDQGRQHLEAAQQVDPQIGRTPAFRVAQAMFEWKAGFQIEAAKWIDSAQEVASDPATVLLLAAIESQRYRLAKQVGQRFQKSLDAELSKRVRGAAVGEMSRVLAAHLEVGTNYPALEKHVKQLSKYIGRASRSKLSEQDLRGACLFLMAAPSDDGLLDKVLRRATTHHPQTPLFWYLMAENEYQRGPFAGNQHLALRCFERARTLIEASPDCQDARLMPQIKQRETLFREMQSRVPVPLAGSGNPLDQLMQMMSAMCAAEGVSMDEVLEDVEDQFGFNPIEELEKKFGGFKRKR